MARIRINFGPSFCGQSSCAICFRDGAEADAEKIRAQYRAERAEQEIRRERARLARQQPFNAPRITLPDNCQSVVDWEAGRKKAAFEKGQAIRARLEAKRAGINPDLMEQTARRNADIRASIAAVEAQNRQLVTAIQAVGMVDEIAQVDFAAIEARLEEERIAAKIRDCQATRELLARTAATRKKIEGNRPKPITLPEAKPVVEMSFADLMGKSARISEDVAKYVGGFEESVENVYLDDREKAILR